MLALQQELGGARAEAQLLQQRLEAADAAVKQHAQQLEEERDSAAESMGKLQQVVAEQSATLQQAQRDRAERDRLVEELQQQARRTLLDLAGSQPLDCREAPNDQVDRASTVGASAAKLAALQQQVEAAAASEAAARNRIHVGSICCWLVLSS